MSESQSRYSIVERVTDKISSALERKNNVKNEIKELQNKINEEKKELEAWKKRALEKLNYREKEKQRMIESMEESLKLEKDIADDRIKLHGEQILSYREALSDIKAISKESNEESSK